MYKFVALVIVLLLLFIYFGPGFASAKTENYPRSTPNDPATRPKPTLVLFYMNGCHACEQFMPAWNKLHNLDTIRESIFSDQYEAAHLPAWASGVTSFPTIRLYKSDPSIYPLDYVQYGGTRTVADLNAFVNQFLQYS